MTPLDKGSKAMFGKMFGKLTAILLFALTLTSTLGAAPFQVEEETAAKKADLTALVEQLKSKNILNGNQPRNSWPNWGVLLCQNFAKH